MSNSDNKKIARAILLGILFGILVVCVVMSPGAFILSLATFFIIGWALNNA